MNKTTYTVMVSHFEAVGAGRNAHAEQVVDVTEHEMLDCERPMVVARLAGWR